MFSLETRHFGIIEVDEKDVLSFPEGMPGFESCKQYTLLGREGGVTPFFWLQGIDQPEIALVVVDPFSIYEEYSIDVDDAEVEILEIDDAKNILILCVVVVPDDIKGMRANLRAPLLINLKNNVGKQVLQNRDDLPMRYLILQ